MNIIIFHGVIEFPKSILVFCNSPFSLLFSFMLSITLSSMSPTSSFASSSLLLIASRLFPITIFANFIFYWFLLKYFISLAKVSLMYSIIFSRPASILIIIALYYLLLMLLISVSLRYMDIVFCYSFIWENPSIFTFYLRLGFFSVLEKRAVSCSWK